jgi:hypothetical protein
LGFVLDYAFAAEKFLTAGTAADGLPDGVEAAALLG